MPPLANAADLAVRLGRSFTSAEQAQAQALLEEASATIRSYTRQDLDRVTTTDELPGTWSRRLVLPQRPVHSVLLVVIDGLAVTDWERVGAVLYRSGGWGRRHREYVDNLYGRLWMWQQTSTPARVVVTYEHGYDQTPADLKAVCVAKAARLWANPTGANSLRIGDYAASHNHGADFTRDELRILNRYRPRSTSVGGP